MSSHRADRAHSGSRSTAGGRRRTYRRAVWRAGPPIVAVLVGLGLLITAVSAAAIDHAISSRHAATAAADTSSTMQESALSSLATTALARDDAVPLSRSAERAAPSHLGKSIDISSLVATRNRDLQTAEMKARAYAKTLASDTWVLPTSNFHITVWFGERGWYWATGYHTGIDFATAYGTPVVAVDDGKIMRTGWDGAYGNQIRLQFPNGDQVWYNHLSAIEVKRGQKVSKGEELGRVGETGNAYGDHLHFEYRLASDLTTAVDPMPFFLKHGINLDKYPHDKDTAPQQTGE